MVYTRFLPEIAALNEILQVRAGTDDQNRSQEWRISG